MVAWLQSQPLDLRELDAKVAAALRAERLVRLNALKLLAARGKLHAALAWIHDFCSSGERLVVFAHHREIQRALLERFPAALHILGEDSHGARDAALRAFQAPDGAGNQLIVCSIEVAGQGLTLTRSSNVVFLELDWTPAKHDQAEDRCHRIGQQDAVNASYLLAAGHDRRDDLDAARAQARGDRRRHRRPRGGRGGRRRRARARAARRALPAPARRRLSHQGCPGRWATRTQRAGRRSGPDGRGEGQVVAPARSTRAPSGAGRSPARRGSVDRWSASRVASMHVQTEGERFELPVRQ